ncbi:hypothetical protein DFS34DRAFT_96665 [Phlyctochytrium arcticum]|nr:hypothetical protein DFS34DRAFT_335104 [Phlyctochytrium arcticum]KAI9098057.1 hypothetical protein DFS34DRAFT_96665 [Phlyctochytrium arcticum]
MPSDDDFFDDIIDDDLLRVAASVESQHQLQSNVNAFDAFSAQAAAWPQQPKSATSAGASTKRKRRTTNDAGNQRQSTLTGFVLNKNGASSSSPKPPLQLTGGPNGDGSRPFVPAVPPPGFVPKPLSHRIDLEAAKSWIYPTNVSVRDYQYNIVGQCLHVNTLVALPTGLGKTFIAAVVMFNFFRWFPDGKIIFMAPTKPLVAQQIEACFKITAIPQDATIELTGSTSPELRRASWANKRVFFLTPQVMQNDLRSGICPGDQVVLLVVDEAHRATGNHAYCEVVRALKKATQQFRILALTATPGSDTKTVQQVVENMLISRIEIRTEDSPDIKPYIFQRSVETVTVPLSDAIISIKQVLQRVCEIYINRLCKGKAFYRHDPSNVTRYELLLARDRWRQEMRAQQGRGGGGGMTPGRAAALEGDFGVAMSLAAGMQLLTVHGIRTCYSHLTTYVDESKKAGTKVSRSRGELLKINEFQEVLDRIGHMTDLPTYSSHPKIERLIGLVVQHFVEHDEGREQKIKEGVPAAELPHTRVMIFSQYRESVDEIVSVLQQHKPMVRVMSFVGQSSGGRTNKKGFSQKEQLRVISEFQNGNYNVLVATSIGEEGLDIGEVDLIICYDVQNSPIRMLQRMGRTGRKRQGKIVLLLTEGKEEDAHRRSQAQYKTVQKAIMDQQGKKLQMYPEWEARVLPIDVIPVCVKEEIKIPEYHNQHSKRKRNSSLGAGETSKTGKAATGPSTETSGPFLSAAEEAEYNDLYRPDLLVQGLPKPDISRYPYIQLQELPRLTALERSSRTRNLVASVRLIDELGLAEEAALEDSYAEEQSNNLVDDDILEVDPCSIRWRPEQILRAIGSALPLSAASSMVVEELKDTVVIPKRRREYRPLLGLGSQNDAMDTMDRVDAMECEDDSDEIESMTMQEALKAGPVKTKSSLLPPASRSMFGDTTPLLKSKSGHILPSVRQGLINSRHGRLPAEGLSSLPRTPKLSVLRLSQDLQEERSPRKSKIGRIKNSQKSKSKSDDSSDAADGDVEEGNVPGEDMDDNDDDEDDIIVLPRHIPANDVDADLPQLPDNNGDESEGALSEMLYEESDPFIVYDPTQPYGTRFEGDMSQPDDPDPLMFDENELASDMEPPPSPSPKRRSQILVVDRATTAGAPADERLSQSFASLSFGSGDADDYMVGSFLERLERIEQDAAMELADEDPDVFQVSSSLGSTLAKFSFESESELLPKAQESTTSSPGSSRKRKLGGRSMTVDNGNGNTQVSQTPPAGNRKRARFFVIDDSPLSQRSVMKTTSNTRGRDADARFLVPEVPRHDDPSALSQMPLSPTSPSGRLLKRLRRVKPVAKHVPATNTLKILEAANGHSPKGARERRLKVSDLRERLSVRAAPRPPPKARSKDGPEGFIPEKVTLDSRKKSPRSKKPKTLPAHLNPFVEHEADVAEGSSAGSGAENGASADECSGGENWDNDLDGFVVNGTQSQFDTPTSGLKPFISPAQRLAFYQRSLLSPDQGGMGRNVADGFAWGRGRGGGGGGRRGMSFATQREIMEEIERNASLDGEDDTLSGFIVDDDEVEDEDSLKSSCLSPIGKGSQDDIAADADVDEPEEIMVEKRVRSSPVTMQVMDTSIPSVQVEMYRADKDAAAIQESMQIDWDDDDWDD